MLLQAVSGPTTRAFPLTQTRFSSGLLRNRPRGSAVPSSTSRLSPAAERSTKLVMSKIHKHMSSSPRPVAATSASSSGFNGSAASEGRVGVIVVDHGSRRAESNANLDEFVQVFMRETGYEIVEPAHMELALPSIADAFVKCVERGVTDIIVSPYFLAPGRHWSKDIPALCAEAAQNHPGVTYTVTAPIGAHPLVARILQERIQHCLARKNNGGDSCPACAGSKIGCLSA